MLESSLKFKGKKDFLGVITLSLAVAVIVGVLSWFPAQADVVPFGAPVNERFVDFQSKVKQERWPAFSEEGFPLGWRPSPLDTSYTLGFRETPLQALPSFYDLREQEKLTSIRNQGSCGSCWSFATYGSLESFLLPGEERDFSEQNMIDNHGFDWGPCEGGNIDMAVAYLTRWSGPVNESDDPYRYTSLAAYPVRKHVQEVIFIPPRKNSKDNSKIKQAVMNLGAVYTSMYWVSNYFNPVHNAYFNPDDESGGHAVAIVGWDDNFSKNKFTQIPQGDGAFIVRNSWSKNWGELGYFYVSYYDEYFARKGFNAVVTAEPTSGYLTNYYYDKYGWTWSLGYGSETAWFANIFTAKNNIPLTAVGFFATGDSNEYEIYIYRNISSGNPRSGNLVRKETGIIHEPGYYTVDLKKSVSIVKGRKFSVVVKLKTKGYNWPIPIEYPWRDYSSKAKAASGQSYISSNGSSWSDLHTVSSGAYANSNVCLKAFSGFPLLYPPANASLERLENDFIFFKEYINHLTWEDNPKNKTQILSYRIYRKEKNAPESAFQLLTEVNPDIFSFYDRGLGRNDYFTYRITCFDEYNRESDPVDISND